MRPRKKDRHLPKCVYHRHGAYWLVKAGKWESLGSNLARALEEYGRRHSASAGSLNGQIDAALAIVRSRVAPSTSKQYKLAGEVIKRMLKQFAQPGQIKPKDIAQVKRLLSPTPNMANRVLSVLRCICEVWVEQQVIDSNPALGVKRYTEKKRTRLVTQDEFNRIYEQADPRLQVIMDLWRLTGQRVVDVLRIRREDLRKGEGIYFRQAKTGAELIVRWNPELVAAVERAKTLYGNVRALTLFHRHSGGPPTYKTVYLQWKRACEAAQITDVQARDLRAMAITATRMQGKNATALAGHKNASMTERYVRDRVIPLVDGPSFGQVLAIGQKVSGDQ